MVQRDVDGLSLSCKQTTAALASSRASTSELLAAMEQVQRSLETSEKRSQLVHTFLEQYQLSPAELAALQVQSGSEGHEQMLIVPSAGKQVPESQYCTLKGTRAECNAGEVARVA